MNYDKMYNIDLCGFKVATVAASLFTIAHIAGFLGLVWPVMAGIAAVGFLGSLCAGQILDTKERLINFIEENKKEEGEK